MAVKLRMTRIGRRHRPFFRINAIDSRAPRDGKILEKLGHYDPIEKNKDKQIVLDTERVQFWLDKGAIPSDTVSQILLRLGIKHKYAEEKEAKQAKARAIAKAKGIPFTKADRLALQKAAEKAEADVKTKAEEKEAKAAEKTEAEEKEAKAAEEESKAEETKKDASSEDTEKSDEN